MPDIIDKATDAIDECQAEALARARGKSEPETHPDFDGVHCVSCDWTEIAPARLKLGKVRCVVCQGDLERREAMRHHNVRVV